MRQAPSGLTPDEHQEVGQELQRLRAHITALRRTILDGHGSGSVEYQSATKVVQLLERLSSTLLLAACAEYEDRGTLVKLRRLYNHEPPQRRTRHESPEGPTLCGRNGDNEEGAMMIMTGVRLVDVHHSSLIHEFSSARPDVWASEDVVHYYDRRKLAHFFTFLGSAASALISYVWNSAMCFSTPEERTHCALTLVWQQRHGVAGGVYRPHQDPKAPTVLPGQTKLFG
jgi:hypothetical protein